MRTEAADQLPAPEVAWSGAAHHSPGVHAALSVLEALMVSESAVVEEVMMEV